MKLIIDVPDNVYAKVMEYYEHNEIVEAVYGYIYCGIPLEQIRAEIEHEADYQDAYVDADVAKGMYMVLEVIDKYTKGNGNEF